jgi:hypothetical protein
MHSFFALSLLFALSLNLSDDVDGMLMGDVGGGGRKSVKRGVNGPARFTLYDPGM